MGRKERWCAAVLLLASFGFSGCPALAEESRVLEPPAAEPADILSRDYATGNWFGLRDAMAQRGIAVELELFADYSYNFSGGLRRGDAFRHLFNLGVGLETEPLLGWKGGTFFLGIQTQNGRNGSEALVGDFQGFDNIDADGFTQVSELWYQQTLLEEKLRIKVGKVDANSEFAYVDYGREFLNSSTGNSPTILGFPTYPDPATSIIAFVYPTEWLYAGVGIFDGATQDGGFGRTGNRGPSTFWDDPSDLFLVGETGLNWKLRNGTLPGRMGFGVWRHSGTFERFDGGRENGTAGFYAVFDQLVWREHPDAKIGDAQGIGVFGQFGWADPEVSGVDQHIGIGAAWSGAIPSRDQDILGLMASAVHFTDESAAGFVDEYETAIELFYKVQLTPWFSLKADLQYILNPGGSGADDAVVGTLRAEIAF